MAVIWRLWFESSLVQVLTTVACTAPSHYMNHCWLIDCQLDHHIQWYFNQNTTSSIKIINWNCRFQICGNFVSAFMFSVLNTLYFTYDNIIGTNTLHTLFMMWRTLPNCALSRGLFSEIQQDFLTSFLPVSNVNTRMISAMCHSGHVYDTCNFLYISESRSADVNSILFIQKLVLWWIHTTYYFFHAFIGDFSVKCTLNGRIRSNVW